MRRRRAWGLTTGVVLTSLTTVAALVLGAPAGAAESPGSFTGYAFDACTAPSQAEMNQWLTTSPFWGVGVYIGGSTRQCEDQPNLTAGWVTRQISRGWKVLPIWVGPQASCTTYPDRINETPGDDYSAARAQGRTEAAAAADAASRLGISSGSTLWYDLEDFDLGSSDDCRRSALSFLSAWTKRLHGLGYASGIYANVAAAVHALDYADSVSRGSYAMPDAVWYAWDNGRADTYIPPRWVRAGSWVGARAHQYALDMPATYGQLTLTIDRSFMAVGRGSVAPRAHRSCGVQIDFSRYRTLRPGDRGAAVRAAQCLLRQKRAYGARIDGRYGRSTDRAVRSFQRSRGLRVNGRLGASTWTVLLSEGPSPVLKYGSSGHAVRRLQRALNAATPAELRVTGVFTARTATAVRSYQQARRLPRTGVVAADTWAQLGAGRV